MYCIRLNIGAFFYLETFICHPLEFEIKYDLILCYENYTKDKITNKLCIGGNVQVMKQTDTYYLFMVLLTRNRLKFSLWHISICRELKDKILKIKDVIIFFL